MEETKLPEGLAESLRQRGLETKRDNKQAYSDVMIVARKQFPGLKLDSDIVVGTFTMCTSKVKLAQLLELADSKLVARQGRVLIGSELPHESGQARAVYRRLFSSSSTTIGMNPKAMLAHVLPGGIDIVEDDTHGDGTWNFVSHHDTFSEVVTAQGLAMRRGVNLEPVALRHMEQLWHHILKASIKCDNPMELDDVKIDDYCLCHGLQFGYAWATSTPDAVVVPNVVQREIMEAIVREKGAAVRTSIIVGMSLMLPCSQQLTSIMDKNSWDIKPGTPTDIQCSQLLDCIQTIATVCILTHPPIAAIEVKVPTSKNMVRHNMKYAAKMYGYQTQAHMAVTGALACIYGAFYVNSDGLNRLGPELVASGKIRANLDRSVLGVFNPIPGCAEAMLKWSTDIAKLQALSRMYAHYMYTQGPIMKRAFQCALDALFGQYVQSSKTLLALLTSTEPAGETTESSISFSSATKLRFSRQLRTTLAQLCCVPVSASQINLSQIKDV